VALKTNGTVLVWGYNEWGQTTVPAGLSRVVAIAAGTAHTVALFIPTPPTIATQPVGRSVKAWHSTSLTVAATGFPLYYQWRRDGVEVAGATDPTFSLPWSRTDQAGAYTVVVNNPAGSVTGSPPAVLTVFPASLGQVVVWGDNSSGQTTVPAAAESGVIAIAVGGSHTLALKNDGSVLAWGNNDYYQSSVPPEAQSGVAAIAAGGGYSMALKTNGAVEGWGIYFGIPVEAQSGVKAIAAGGNHTVALKTNGAVLVWGSGGGADYGQTLVPLAAQSGVTAIAAGGAHVLALKNDGSVVAWGANNYGQTNVPLAAQSGVVAVAAGNSHSVALKNDGSVVAWGLNASGQTDVPVAAQSGVTAIATAGYFTLALKTDGTVVEWPDQSGVLAVPPGLSPVTAIAAGYNHAVALLSPAPAALVSLSLRPSTGSLVLSWPTNAVGFTLQSAPDPTPGSSWSDVTNPPVVVDGRFTVTNTMSGPARFFRLRKP
jgi:alpha-tubulin suppressor-like RCC1 family protein